MVYLEEMYGDDNEEMPTEAAKLVLLRLIRASNT